MTGKYIITLISLFLLAMPMVSQTRLTEDKKMKDLGKTSRRFTLNDRMSLEDYKGLRRSEYTGSHHAVGLYLYGGYASIYSSSKLVSVSPGGYNLRFGGVYEYRYRYFTVQTGLGIAYKHITSNLGSYNYTNISLSADDNRWAIIADSWGERINELTYDIENRQDRLSQVYAQVPILLGINFYGLYALAGITPAVPLSQRAVATMDITSRGSYKRYYGLGDGQYWEEMDNHGYRKQVPLRREIKPLPFRMDFILSVEAGYDWLVHENTHLRFAAFLDGSINRVSGTSDKASMYIPYDTKWDFETFEATPIWYSEVVKNEFTHHFSAGLKITLLFSFKQMDKCILCSQKYK